MCTSIVICLDAYIHTLTHTYTQTYRHTIYTRIPAYIDIYIIYTIHIHTHMDGLAWEFQQAKTNKRYRHQAKETTEDTNNAVLKARVGTLYLLYTLHTNPV